MKNKKVSTVLSVILYVLIGILILTVGVLLFGKFSGKTVFVGNKTLLYVQTDSMAPAIPEKSYILVEKVDTASIKVGDIITFRSDDPKIKGSLNTHRVKAIDPITGNFITKGDHNYGEDLYPARKDAVEGRFVKVLPGFSSFMNNILTAKGIILLFVFFILLSVLCYLPDILKWKREKSNTSGQQVSDTENTSLSEEELEKLVQIEVEKLKNKNQKDEDDQHVQENQTEKED